MTQAMPECKLHYELVWGTDGGTYDWQMAASSRGTAWHCDKTQYGDSKDSTRPAFTSLLPLREHPGQEGPSDLRPPWTPPEFAQACSEEKERSKLKYIRKLKYKSDLCTETHSIRLEPWGAGGGGLHAWFVTLQIVGSPMGSNVNDTQLWFETSSAHTLNFMVKAETPDT